MYTDIGWGGGEIWSLFRDPQDLLFNYKYIHRMKLPHWLTTSTTGLENDFMIWFSFWTLELNVELNFQDFCQVFH